MHLLPVNNGDERLPWAEPVVPMYQKAQVADWRCVPTPGLKKVIFGYVRICSNSGYKASG